MLDGRPFLEFLGGKLRVSTRNVRLVLICYIFAATLELVSSSGPLNPCIGVNYYGKAQKTTPKTLPSGFEIHKADDCSNSPNNTSGIQRGKPFQAPDFLNTAPHGAFCNSFSPYRRYDGKCINPMTPRLGMANDCYLRFIPAHYNGFGGFRKSVSGRALPEPRDISLRIFKDRHKPEIELSFQFMIFGQLVAHDMSRAVQPQTDCCLPANAQKEECTPIFMRPNDPFYSRYNKSCMDFQRSDKCTFGKTMNREQKNGATAALDGSVIYGVSENQVKSLRTLDGTGRLKFNVKNRISILPTGKDPEDIFCPKSIESKCFLSGDPRVNQHAFLTIVQTVFMSEHNRLAEELKKLNPHWGEEKLFQEARKLVIAEIQSITYQDFLPILLTPRIVKQFNINIKKDSTGSSFNSAAAIGVWQEFSHAAFRLHSTVPWNIGSMNLRFKDTYSNPDLIRNGHMSDLIRGSQQVPNEKFDRYMIKDLTNYLYEEPGVPYGKDLAATNIQRGRDHGLAPYVEIVKFCSDRTININSFDDLIEKRIMPKKNVNLLKKIYGLVEDVDMWVGMQLEHHMPGSIMGPSAICVTAKQFFFTQKGDRLFFNHVGQSRTFTEDQRRAIKTISLGRVLCDNTNIKQIPKNTFLLPSDDNPMVCCDEIPKIDLSFWKEHRPVFSRI